MIERELEEFSILIEEWNQIKELCRVFEVKIFLLKFYCDFKSFLNTVCNLDFP